VVVRVLEVHAGSDQTARQDYLGKNPHEFPFFELFLESSPLSELYVFRCPKVCGLLMEALHVAVLCVAGQHPHLTPNLLSLVFTGPFSLFF
jgi:hypothetical protein